MSKYEKEETLFSLTDHFTVTKNDTIKCLMRTSFGSITVYDFVFRKVLFSQWNLLRALKYSPAEFHDMSCDFFNKILHPDDKWIMQLLIQKISESKGEEVFNSTFRLCDKQGKYQRVVLRSSVIKRHPRGTPQELIASLVCIGQYEGIKRQREKNISMMENLSYRASHELRAPFATVLGLVRLLRHPVAIENDTIRIIQSLETTVTKMDNAIKEFSNALNAESKQMNVPIQSEQIIADNRHYSLKVNIDKNRAYLKIKGYWRSPDSVPDYIVDWKKAIVHLKRNFTILTDASEMKTHPREVRHLHEEVQKIIGNAGIKKVAEIINDDIAEMQLNSMAKQTSFPKKNFHNTDDAEIWLNKYSGT